MLATSAFAAPRRPRIRSLDFPFTPTSTPGCLPSSLYTFLAFARLGSGLPC